MIADMRGLWRRAGDCSDTAAERGGVELRHVRSHTKVPGNELADWLADRGRFMGDDDETPTVVAGGWLRRWIQTLRDPVGVG